MVVVPQCPVDLGDELAQGLESVRISEVNFEFVVERLLVPILPWRPRPAPRDRDTVRFEYADEYPRLVLTPVVRMEEYGFRMMEERIPERLHRKR